MKIRVPEPPDFPVPGLFRKKGERIALVKYLKRASGSFAGETESKRENVFLIGIESGDSRMAPA